MDLAKLEQLSEEQARAYLEGIRWPRGPVCPHCRAKGATRLLGSSTRPGVFKCRRRRCRKQFTVTSATVLNGAHLPMKTLLLAIYLFGYCRCSAANLAHANPGISYRSARRLRDLIIDTMYQKSLADRRARADKDKARVDRR